MQISIRQGFGFSGFCVETRPILIVYLFTKIALKVFPSKHLRISSAKIITQSREDTR